MANWKEILEVQKESLRLGLAEGGFSFLGFIKGLPAWKRALLIIIAGLIIPASFAVRYGVQYYTEWQLKSSLISAHQSFLEPQDPKLSGVKILSVGPEIYAAYVEITNENLDVAASAIPYRFDFYNSADEKIVTISGVDHLLPNQKKYLIAPRVESVDQIKSGTVTLGEAKWQKRLILPTVELKAPSPIIYNSTNPFQIVLEGVVVNNSPYRLAAVRLQFILYDKTNKIMAVSQRDEYDLPAFARRAYKQSWPNLYKENVGRTVVLTDTNTVDGSNLIPEDVDQSGTNLDIPSNRQ